ncbi:MAG: LPS translocon maturation chaperone LptM [Gammaproteobacteria bacterium]
MRLPEKKLFSGLILLTLATLLLLCGCGQKGSLYLPDKPATTMAPVR